MDFKFSDSRVFTDKEKKYYTTTKGQKLDLTWKPTIIDRLYKEYTELLFDIKKMYPIQLATLERVKKGDVSEEDTDFIENFANKIDEYRNKFDQILIAALKANGLEVNSEWIEENLVVEEKDIILQIIMDIYQEQFNLKKK